MTMLDSASSVVGQTIRPLIFLNSYGFGLLITNQLLSAAAGTLLEVLGVGGEDSEVQIDANTVSELLEQIMDTMSLGLFFDENGGMSIQINLTRNGEEVTQEDGSMYESVGLSATISLLHDSMLNIGLDKFNEFYNYLTTDPEMLRYYQRML